MSPSPSRRHFAEDWASNAAQAWDARQIFHEPALAS